MAKGKKTEEPLVPVGPGADEEDIREESDEREEHVADEEPERPGLPWKVGCVHGLARACAEEVLVEFNKASVWGIAQRVKRE